MAERLDPKELGRLGILRGVPLESVTGLLQRCAVRQLATGECLLIKGAPNRTMYMILSGVLRVHLDSLESEPVARLEGGQTVGELSVIDESPASATVVAAEPSRLLVVEDDVFWRLVAASHEFAVNLLLLFAERMRANNTVLTRHASLRRQLEREALVDGLTGLHNRRWLDQKLPRLVRRAQRSGEPLSLLVVDIDHFKIFNDTFGHTTGDLVLATVAKTLTECLRPTDMTARYGGEELVVILPDTPLSGAVVAATRLLQRVRELELSDHEGQRLPQITVSVGAAELGEHADHALLFNNADAALYRAKHGGRDRVES
jgi:diguanylate cyclase (GGDEF)-like protein